MAEKKKNEMQNVAEQVVKKRERKDKQLQVQEGDNTHYLNHNMKLFMLPELDTLTEENVQGRIVEYFNICAEDDMKPSVSGLALAFNITRQQLWNWVNGKVDKAAPYVDILKKAYKLLEAEMNDYMQNGKINPVAGIFLMKNHYGYADKTEVVVEPRNPLGDLTEQAALEQRYIEDATE